jgi:hypothetical protein
MTNLLIDVRLLIDWKECNYPGRICHLEKSLSGEPTKCCSTAWAGYLPSYSYHLRAFAPRLSIQITSLLRPLRFISAVAQL